MRRRKRAVRIGGRLETCFELVREIWFQAMALIAREKLLIRL